MPKSVSSSSPTPATGPLWIPIHGPDQRQVPYLWYCALWDLRDLGLGPTLGTSGISDTCTLGPQVPLTLVPLGPQVPLTPPGPGPLVPLGPPGSLTPPGPGPLAPLGPPGSLTPGTGTSGALGTSGTGTSGSWDLRDRDPGTLGTLRGPPYSGPVTITPPFCVVEVPHAETVLLKSVELSASRRCWKVLVMHARI
jgi:hypothetical protein